MRRNKKQEINIFSMSALDLFASALGAFILIAVIALPYYLNTDKENIRKLEILKNKNKLQKEKIEKQTKQIKELEKKVKDTIKFAFLGIATKATSFVILVDLSGSMKEYKLTITDAIYRIIEPMENKCKVQLIGFQGSNAIGKITNWNSPYNTKFLDTNNLNNLKSFTQNLMLQVGDGTPTKYALKEALKYNTEAIILLTDGSPNNSDTDAIVQEVTNLNNKAKEIHTIAIGDYLKNKKLSDFLKKLASKNRGYFLGLASID